MPLLADLRVAVRSLLKRPGLVLVVALSLGLGISAVTSILMAVDTLLVRPLPYDPDNRLVFVGPSDRGRGGAWAPSSVPDFRDLRASSRTLSLAAYRDVGVNLGPEPVSWATGRRVSAGFFSTLGVDPVIGRGIRAEDETPGTPEVVLLGHPLWERRYGADPGILGRQVTVDGVPATVVGVLPAGFEFGWDSPELWLPLRMGAEASRTARTVNVIGRMGDADIDATREELATLGEGLAESFPATNAERTFHANGVRDEWYGSPAFQQGSIAALVASVLVLLIGCANVANLLLARGSDRAGELAVRRALGASRRQLLRQLMVEASALAVLGGLVAVPAAMWAPRGMRAVAPEGLPGLHTVHFDARALTALVVIVVLTTLVIGLVPTLRALRSPRRRDLGVGRGRRLSSRSGGLRSGLVVAEVTMAVVLVATMGLALRSVDRLMTLETGFDTENALTFALDLPAGRYETDLEIREVTRRLEEELRAIPRVDAAGLSLGLPGLRWGTVPFAIPGDGTDGDVRSAPVRFATPGWLDAVGLRLVRGRALTDTDAPGAPNVVLINESFAERNWPAADPLGRTLELRGRPARVVGIVEDAHERGPAAPAPAGMYAPLAQWPVRSLDVVLRSTAETGELLQVARDALAAVDPDVAIHDVATFAEVIELSAEEYVAMGRFLTILGGIALFLAINGVHASMRYSVARRVPEIGVRMALGADRASVRGLILREALVLSGVGLLIGLPAATLAGRGLSAFMFEVGSVDLWAFAGIALLLLTVCAAAAWLPAWRAGRVDPVEALRAD